MSKPFFPSVDQDGNPERSQDRTSDWPSDWLRLIAIWSWLRYRPSATFDEFLAALPAIDAFVARGSKR